tara:strand:+ start:7505 stop:8227 length:723 start_codon:yes stop_codon:yes gene_type:complete
MGWFSDALFGKRKRMDKNKINDYMKPYTMMIDEQEQIARDMMDPNSRTNVMAQQQMRSNQMDTMAMQNQGLLQSAAMTGMSPGQAAMQARQNMNTGRAQMGNQFQGLMASQNQMGLGMLGNVMGMKQGEGERQANMYMQEINAHNARRQANMSMTTQLAGAAIGAFASDKRLKQNIELVGKSPKGFNIYEFEYKDKQLGPGTYQGVLSEEVPFASLKDPYGYELVNYSHPDLDVEFKRIK